MNTEMKIFETEIKDIQELQAKARKYDRLKNGIENLIKQYQHRLEGQGYSINPYRHFIEELQEVLK